MSGKRARVFSREFKEAAVLRVLAGEKVVAVAAELALKPQQVYLWWSMYDRGGAAALRPSSRPRRGDAVIEPSSPLPASAARRRRRGRPRAVHDEELAKENAELKRKVGEQALVIDFFRRALRHVKARPRSNDGRGDATSSR